MSLPDFLIIGAMKSGSTWLHDILTSHSEIEMPVDRKETHYFTRYYDRGIDWYESKFPRNTSKLIGETTPSYLSAKACPSRIAELLPEVKLICILRNPADRAFSHYNFLKRETNMSQTFWELAEIAPDILKNGLYFTHLERYSHYFKMENVKVIIFERMLKNKEATMREICEFLKISYDFDFELLHDKSNVSKKPRFHLIYAATKKITSYLYKKDHIFLINLLKRIGIKKVFFAGKRKERDFSPMSDSIRKELSEYYREEIDCLEKLFEIDLNIWKNQ